MKKLTTIIIGLSLMSYANAQEAFAEYNSTYFENVNEVLIDVKNEYKYDLYIYMFVYFTTLSVLRL